VGENEGNGGYEGKGGKARRQYRERREVVREAVLWQ